MAGSEYPVIQTGALTKVFRDFWGHKRVIAVDELDLEVYGQEVFGLLGPNGSGKSTTIKMLLGLLFPSRGWARVLDQPPGDVKTNSRIGFLPEESHLYPFLDARETLDFYGRLFGLPSQERRRRIDSLLDMVGLGGVGKRPVGEFSKGMARRIGLAQALINDPDLLILDEPTTGLDPIGTRQIKDLISQLGRRGKTVLLCSHLLADVEDVCDRIGILYGGKMQALGSVAELLTQSDMTQIRSPRLTDELIAKIRDIIAHEHPNCRLDVQTPRSRLEEFFLDIVAKAQAARLQTSGAVVGSGVSDFLSDDRQSPADTPGQLIEELVAGSSAVAPNPPGADDSAATAAAATTVNAGPSDEVRRDMLESLVDGAAQTGNADKERSQQAPPITTPVGGALDDENIGEPQQPDSSKVDLSVIDELTTDTHRAADKSADSADNTPNSPDNSDNKNN